MNTTQQSERTVRTFLEIVRSGREPERATEFMADTVLANQMNSENPETVKRTPQNYTAHIKEFLNLYGSYLFEITELIASKDKVYVRWKQTGKHLAVIDGFKPTGLPLTEIGSAVYRVANGKIVEYWIQLDRQGFEIQLQQNEKINNGQQNSEPAYPLTAAVALGETLYISGQIGVGDSSRQLINTDFMTEADQVMKNIGNILKQHNLTYLDLVNVTIYLTTMDNYAATNEVYRKYFKDYFPARVCIAVKELPLQAHIEISAVARVKPK